MITDPETNQIYLADSLKPNYPSFEAELTNILQKHNYQPRLIPGTSDIWCRDYMPVQIGPGKFVGFNYNPTYLNNEKYAHTRSDNRKICEHINLKLRWSDIVLDGGNVVKWKNKAIVTDMIFRENAMTRASLTNQLRDLFEVDELIVIPRQPYDFTGHADGMIRFLDEHTVLVNDNPHESEYFKNRFNKALKNHKLETEIFPYAYEPRKKKKDPDTAQGIYINYLHLGNLIVLPQFWLLQDETAHERIQQLYPNADIETINANGVALQGGVLNCLTWTIQEDLET